MNKPELKYISLKLSESDKRCLEWMKKAEELLKKPIVAVSAKDFGLKKP